MLIIQSSIPNVFLGTQTLLDPIYGFQQGQPTCLKTLLMSYPVGKDETELALGTHPLPQ